TVLRWEPNAAGVRVFTAHHSYTASRLLISAGAWLSSLIPGLALPLSIERQVLTWYQPRADTEQFHPDRFPIQIWQYAPQGFFYCIPDLGDGVKIALHHQGEPAQPELLRAQVDERDTEAIRELLRRFLPAAEGPLKSTAV